MMYPILLCSVTGFGIAIERLIFLSWRQTQNRRFMDRVGKIADGDEKRIAKISAAAKSIPSPISAIVRAAIESKDAPEQKRNAVIWRAGSNQRRSLEQYIGALGIIGHIAPLMGLLGTVIGMIRAFMTIQSLGGQVSATDLAGGIWEALITTGAGLSVAIPAMIFYYLLESQVDRILAYIKDAAVMFPEIMNGFSFGGAQAGPNSEGGGHGV